MKRVLTALCILGLLAFYGCSDNTANMTPEQVRDAYRKGQVKSQAG